MVTLGNSGIRVSRFCLGTLTLGPLQCGLSPEDGGRVIAHAIARGVNFFDTAQLYQTYGHLREGMRLARRDDIVISTKTYAHTREMAADAVDEARRALNRDRIDIFMLHEQESEHTLRGHRDALEYLFECREKGIIRAVGTSMHHIAAVRAAARAGLDVIHPIFNIAGLGIADGTADEMRAAIREAHAAGVGVFAMKALGGGNLLAHANEALRYVLCEQSIDATAVGCQSAEEVDANLYFFERGSFTENQRENLAAKKRRLHIESYCEGCGRCVRRCGQSALRLCDGKARVDAEKCVLCGYCAQVCPAFAIRIL